MGATTVLERETSEGLVCRVFVSFLPIPDEARRACGFCGARAEQVEPVGNWGLVAPTCEAHRLFDPET